LGTHTHYVLLIFKQNSIGQKSFDLDKMHMVHFFNKMDRCCPSKPTFENGPKYGKKVERNN